MLPLNDEQRILVEENMGLVGKVIKDCLQNPSAQGCYTYDDLFQIGCIGLCKAAQTDRPGRGTSFSPSKSCSIRVFIISIVYITIRLDLFPTQFTEKCFNRIAKAFGL